MAEGLQLQVRWDLLADLRDLPERQLPGQHHPLGSQVIPRPGRAVVADGLLGGDVALTVGGVLPGQGEGPQVGQDQRVHAGGVQLLQVGREPRRLVVARHGVDRHMDPDAPLMGVGHGPGQVLGGEVPRKGPHPEGRSGQVHGVRAVGHGQLEPLEIPRRAEKLRLFSLLHGALRHSLWAPAPSTSPVMAST